MKNFILKNCFYFTIPVAILLGWFAHFYYSTHIQDRSKEIVQVRQNSSDYKFINPLLFVADNRGIQFQEYDGLEGQLKNYISAAKKEGEAQDVSFYLRDLNQGDWLGIDEDRVYAPASMLKVSVMLAYLKLADERSGVLSEQANYTPSDESGQFYKPAKTLSPGLYSANELISQMIMQSDNGAMMALDSLHADEILEIYKELRLPDLNQESLDFMSPREYSRIFRALYNGSYVSHAYSEQALELLSKTNFDFGLKAGVSSTTVTVSHKFGELTNIQGNVVTEKELHDCGIVYYPEKPYFICVMTRGDNFPNLQKIIADISKITFDYYNKNNK